MFTKFKRIFIIEEHYVSGGAGSSIIEWANKNSFNSEKIHLFGADNKFVHAGGNQSSARDKAGLSSKKIFKKIMKIIRNR